MSDSIIIFLNKDAVKIDELFLNEDWSLTKIFPNIYSISVKGQELQWLVKIYDEIRYAKQESLNLEKLKDIDGVPKILSVSLSKKLSYIILSKAKGIDLFEYFKAYRPLSEVKVKSIIHKLLVIVQKVHSRNVVHKDIKTENIMYDDASDTIVLIDFEGKYTIQYGSPEQMCSRSLTPKTDVWSIGVACYMLLHGIPPFNNKNEILYGKLRLYKGLSADCKDFLRCLLERDITNRYSIENALNHPWIVM